MLEHRLEDGAVAGAQPDEHSVSEHRAAPWRAMCNGTLPAHAALELARPLLRERLSVARQQSPPPGFSQGSLARESQLRAKDNAGVWYHERRIGMGQGELAGAPRPTSSPPAIAMSLHWCTVCEARRSRYDESTADQRRRSRARARRMRSRGFTAPASSPATLRAVPAVAG